MIAAALVLTGAAVTLTVGGIVAFGGGWMLALTVYLGAMACLAAALAGAAMAAARRPATAEGSAHA